MDRDTSLLFGKLLAAIAWADNEIQNARIGDTIEALVCYAKRTSGQKDWFLIRLYLEYPQCIQKVKLKLLLIN